MDDKSTDCGGLREEIVAHAWAAIRLCSIEDNETVSDHWELLTPICDLIKGSVLDENSIPHLLAVVESKASEMRRRINEINLNQMVAYNIFQMISGFVKFMKTSSLIAPTGSPPDDMTAEIERLKNELFTYQNAYEREKREKDELMKGGEKLRDLVSKIFGDERDNNKNIVVKPLLQPNLAKAKKIVKGGPMTRGRKNTHLMRTVTTSETVAVPQVSPLSLLPSSSPQDPPLSVHFFSAIQDAIQDHSVVPMDEKQIEKEKKKETKRRRRNESPLHKLLDEDEGSDMKRNCGETGGDDSYLMCPFSHCGRTFNRICTLSEHTTSDHYWQGALQVQCSLCRSKYESDRAFETHSINCPTAYPIMTMKKWDHEETDEERDDRLELEKKLLSCPYPGCDYVSKSKSRSIFKHMNKSHGNDGRAWYKCDCGKKRRTLHTILFHHYSECREGVIDWLIESPPALKTEDCTDDGSAEGT